MKTSDVARCCGITIAEYEACEAGARRFHAWELAEIAKALDVGVGDIMLAVTDPENSKVLAPSRRKTNS